MVIQYECRKTYLSTLYLSFIEKVETKSDLEEFIFQLSI